MLCKKQIVMKSLVGILAILWVFSSGFNAPVNETGAITAAWVRVGDRLRIEVKERNENVLESYITQEGNEKFPCEVSDLPIYKDITKVGRNLWRCKFLVVTMGSCSTEYEEGMIRLLPGNKMEITCPGFAKKVYERSIPRYESD
jgi:hypothetical protein